MKILNDLTVKTYAKIKLEGIGILILAGGVSMGTHIGFSRKNVDLHIWKHFHTSAHSGTCAVSCFALQSLTGERALFFVQDLLDVSNDLLPLLKRTISEITGVCQEQICIAGMHMYSENFNRMVQITDKIAFVESAGSFFAEIAREAENRSLEEPFCIGKLLGEGRQPFFNLIVNEHEIKAFEKHVKRLLADVTDTVKQQISRICRILKTFKNTKLSCIKDDTIRRAIDKLEECYCHAVTTKDIAGMVGLERSYFSTVFKAQVGMSPHRYLILLRLLNACLLIERTDESLSCIAETVGLDPQNFSRFFKRELGIMPREYKTNRYAVLKNNATAD